MNSKSFTSNFGTSYLKNFRDVVHSSGIWRPLEKSVLQSKIASFDYLSCLHILITDFLTECQVDMCYVIFEWFVSHKSNALQGLHPGQTFRRPYLEKHTIHITQP